MPIPRKDAGDRIKWDTPTRRVEWTAATMGRKGGKAKSEAKTRAVRANITDAWIAKRLTVEERDAIRWALGEYLARTSEYPTDFDLQRRINAESALAKLQVGRMVRQRSSRGR